MLKKQLLRSYKEWWNWRKPYENQIGCWNLKKDKGPKKYPASVVWISCMGTGLLYTFVYKTDLEVGVYEM